jgi:ElaB/YqjD/DUF883 family membrane-anchored ribosome-binding protein
MNQANTSEANTGASHESSAQDRRRRSKRGEAAESQGPELGRWREVGVNLGSQVDEQVHKRPYIAVAVAVGLGFIAGSLLGNRLGQIVLAFGIGYAAKSMLGDRAGLETLHTGLERLTGETGAVD